MSRTVCVVVCGVFASLAPQVGIAQPVKSVKAPTREQIAFFEKNIRPVLVRKCYQCHGTDSKKIESGLTLATRAGVLQGGDRGAAIVPGDVKGSLLLQAIRHEDRDFTMPPKEKLPKDVIANFEKWVAMGAPDPRDGGLTAKKGEIDIPNGRKFWSFRVPTKPTAPKVKNTAWAKSDIDRFLLAGLEKQGLKPVDDAEPEALVRRIYFDLVGIPPTSSRVKEFIADHASDPQAAVAKVVDRLLATSLYGQRWGRHWLDVARYGESSGRSSNIAYPHAWRYRDYVIDSFNKDKPYDQFIREQLAGDLLDFTEDKQRAENLVATGFLAIGPKNHDQRDRRQFAFDLADEQIDATFQAFQGLTVACAKCHDHKFDPIPQRDYYALLGIFVSTETRYGTVRIVQSNHPSRLIPLPDGAKPVLPGDKLTSERREQIESQIKSVREQMENLSGENANIRRLFSLNRITLLQSQLALYESDGTPKALAMGVNDYRFGDDSRFYERGELSEPRGYVRRGFPQVRTKSQPNIRRGSGRRELADFIASKDNPLTARVMVNRIWLHLMGKGLVSTADNFGASGLPPTNPELLDHLAIRFVEEGWSVKKLIREIILSRAYQLSSQFDKHNYEVDPDNVLVWRMPRRRLEAEAIRDTMLWLGEGLNLEPSPGSSVQRNGEGSLSFAFNRISRRGTQSEDNHRTVYQGIVRDGTPESLSLFDFPDPSLIIGQRATTTVPAQALYLLNNPFVIQQAEAWAGRLLAGNAKTDEERIELAYLDCFSRKPSEKELKSAKSFLDDYGKTHSRRAAWSALCQAFFGSAEFLHR